MYKLLMDSLCAISIDSGALIFGELDVIVGYNPTLLTGKCAEN